LGAFERGVSEDRQALLARPFSERVAFPAFRRFAGPAGRVLPQSVVASIQRRLVLAGDPLSLQSFAAIELAAVASGVVLVVAATSRGVTAVTFLAMLGVALVLALAPIYW